MWKIKSLRFSVCIILCWAALFLVNDTSFNTRLRYANVADIFGYAVGYIGGSVLFFVSFVYIGGAVAVYWTKRIKAAWSAGERE